MADKPKTSKTANQAKPAVARKAKTAARKTPAAKPGKSKSAAPKTVRVKPAKTAPPGTGAELEANNIANNNIAQNASFYVSITPGEVRIQKGQPASAGSAGEYQSFAEARDRALDQLIELIEAAERQLHQLRRASTFEDIDQAG